MMTTQNYYVIILNGICGESTHPRHPDGIDVLSWSYGVRHQLPPPIPTDSNGDGVEAGHEDGDAAEVIFDNFRFAHFIDKSSPALRQHCADGTVIPTVELRWYRADNISREYATFTLGDCVVTEVAAVGGLEAVEHVSLAYGSIRIEISEADEDDQMGTIFTNRAKKAR